MGTLVNMGVKVAEARECWRLRGESGMCAAIRLILYEFLSLEEVLDGPGDCGGVWNVEVVSLL